MPALGLVSYAILSALAAGIVTVALKGRPQVAKTFALVSSVVPLAFATVAFLRMPGLDEFAFEERHEWIPAIGASLHFGLDGLSAPMFFLSALLTTLGILFSWDVKVRVGEFMGLLLVLEASLLGVFASLDYFAFYVFWEFVLIPMFFIIAIWGGPNRRYASIKFFVYTFGASLVMLLGIMALYFAAGRTFDMLEIADSAAAFGRTFQILVFGALAVGFLVKFPVVPFHTWLPDAHVEAPTAGSVLLAGVLLKMGSYGLLRAAIPAAPFGARVWVPVLVVIAFLSILWGAIVCLSQRDVKRLIAYSSISHMGLVLLGIATFTKIGIVGALFMMFAHGLISPFLFMMAGVLHHGAGTRIIDELGGIAQRMPYATAFFMAGAMASLGLPGMAGFVAEFTVFLATFQAFGWLVLVPIVSIIVTAAYYIWAMERTFFGVWRARAAPDEVHDVKLHEALPLAVLLALFTLYGLAPDLLTDQLNPATDAFLALTGGL
ncbi:MAG: complex I subunit 4 family protein [Methanobacteriota archaeon]